MKPIKFRFLLNSKSSLQNIVIGQLLVVILVMACILFGTYLSLQSAYQEMDQIMKNPAGAEQSAVPVAGPARYEMAKKTLDQRTQQISTTVSSLFILASILSVIGVLVFMKKKITQPLSEATGQLNENTSQVMIASNQLSYTAFQFSQGSAEQTDSIAKTVAVLQRFTNMLEENNNNTWQAAELLEKAKIVAEKGNQEMQQMMNAMNEIKKSGDQIVQIIKTIDDIAFQTNILALNAAVEAARAGETGVGFAVVAEEVRNLATRSAQSAQDSAMKIEANMKQSENGVNTAARVRDSLAEIAAHVANVTAIMEGITKFSREQLQGIRQIDSAINQIETVAMQNAASAEGNVTTSESVYIQNRNIRNLIQRLSQSINGKSLTFALVYPSRQPFYTACTIGAQAEAKKCGLNVMFEASISGEPFEQVKLIEELTAKQVDGIALSPADAKAVEPAIARAIESGIPVVTFDSDSPKSKRINHIGTDQYKAARQAAKVMANLIHGQGEIIISQGIATLLCQQQRIQGFKQAIAEYPGIKIVDIKSSGGNILQTLSNIENMLKNHPDVAGIYGTDANVGLVISQILKNHTHRPAVVVFDDMPETIQAIREGLIDTTIVQKPYDWAVYAIQALLETRAGKKLPEILYTDTLDVNKTNVEQVYREKIV